MFKWLKLRIAEGHAELSVQPTEQWHLVCAVCKIQLGVPVTCNLSGPPSRERFGSPGKSLETCIARSLLPNQAILMQVVLGTFKNRVSKLFLVKVQMINILDLVGHIVPVILSSQFY